MTPASKSQPAYYVSQFDLDHDGHKDHIVFSFIKTDEKHAVVAGKAVLANGQMRDLGQQSYNLPGVTNHGKKLEAFRYPHGGFDAHQLYLLPNGVEIQHEQLCQTIDDSDAKYNYPNQQCSDPIQQIVVTPEKVNAAVRAIGDSLSCEAQTQWSMPAPFSAENMPGWADDALLQRFIPVWFPAP